MQPVNNALYLRRRGKVVVPTGSGEGLPASYGATLLKNLETLGYTFSEPLIQACLRLSVEQLGALYAELVPVLKGLRGAHRVHRPMYPNFPDQVMEMSEGELYLNAVLHYNTDGQLFPYTEVRERLPLFDDPKLTILDLGTEAEFRALFTQIAGSNASLSEGDREDLTWFVRTYGDEVGALLPASIPQRENVAFISGLLLRHTTNAVPFIARYCRTATDVLRLAVSLSEGDVSLAEPAKLRSFTRRERRLLLAVLESASNLLEDMVRWKGRWLRLGERLHPGEYAAHYPATAAAFQSLRSGETGVTFNSAVEASLAQRDVLKAVSQLRTRPGDLARRLDHLLRTSPKEQDHVLDTFAGAAHKVSTPVLLQVRQHFLTRPEGRPLRVFFPKGSVAKAQGIPNTLPDLPDGTCRRAVEVCEAALTARFRELPPLGKVYVDPELERYLVPFSQRSASKSLRTLVRGSRLPLPECEVLRFFVWWRNGKSQTDLDLSAVMLDGDCNYVGVVSYYDLKGMGCAHSGDIVDAPKGAAEFIDVTIEKILAQGARYVVMSLNSYSYQPFVELPECFAGWMARSEPGSGEIFEPKTVQDRLDLTANTRVAIPLVIDLVDQQVVWCDLALRSNPNWQNNVEANRKGIGLSVKALIELDKPNLLDLFTLHARARGELVDTPEEAETVFSVANETPYRLEEIASEYLQ